MTKLKIAQVCPYNITKSGGVAEIIIQLKRHLTSYGHQVSILTPLPRETLEHIPKDIADDIIFVGGGTEFRAPTHTSVQIAASMDLDNISAILNEHNFDILHFHEPWVPVLGRQILSRSTAVNIATFHADIPETIMSRTVIKVSTPYMQSILKYIDAYTAVSQVASAFIGQLTTDKIEIIPNGIDLSIFKTPNNTLDNSSRSDMMILYIGRLEKRKGVKYLLKAYAKIMNNGPYRLVIAGDGPDRERLQLLAEDLGLVNCQFLGYIEDELKLKLLASASLFCSPAVYGESFGIVLLEAMATATPFLAGNNAGYLELLKDVGQLAIVDPHDSNEFARMIELYCQSSAVRQQLINWGKQYVKQFNFNLIAKRYEKYYYQTLSASPKKQT